VYSDEAFLNGAMRSVACSLGRSGHVLEVRGAGVFTVTPDGTSIEYAEEPGADPSLLEAVRLGPALILALALQERFCLHASAVLIGGKAVAFLGDSGAGKSTLATLLSRAGLAQRVADDILPVGAGPAAFPGFPQLKLSPEEQPCRSLPESLPLAAVYLLEPPIDGEAEVASRLLGKRDGMVALLAHTVAARLFGPDLLAQHLQIFAGIAERVPVRRLGYPRRLTVGGAVHRVVAADLEAADA
jgi:hypothetical protein